ncbi:hypothetical protein F511_17545 [Dorcoceras hygrometricum]|uniref:Retrotransposon gag domain-containing protein n=1 Tax=Dorcoceras hygrometricum TaxID=472368 RepID=A0A2Z7CZ66_9LAMI|nr:hypothetical protein F511_17545 [Dorcoceras hygrometricum]
MGPISNIGPKTSWAARDRPEYNSEVKTGRNPLPEHRRTAVARRRPPPPRSVRRSAACLPQCVRRMAHDAPTSGASGKHRPAANRATIAREISSSGRTPCEMEAANPRPPCAYSAHVARAHMRVQRRVVAAAHGGGRRPSSNFCAWLQPDLQEHWLFTVGAVDPPIRSTPESIFLRSICTRRLDGFCHGRNHLVAVIETSLITKRAANGGGRRRATCVTLNGSGIQLAVGPQPLRLRNHNFGLVHRIMVKRLTTSPHDPIGITDSACKNQFVVVSVHYGHFNTYIPIRSMTIGKSSVARDPIAMHTSWRSNSDIASVTSVSMTFRVVRTNQYNQDLGLIHSTNGNHLESLNEGSSIDHQVTIHLHAQNITMFPTNETCSDAESWLQHITRLFDQVRYENERILSLATFQLRKNAERWWRGASRTLEETGAGITWDSFCTAFRQEYVRVDAQLANLWRMGFY